MIVPNVSSFTVPPAIYREVTTRFTVIDQPGHYVANAGDHVIVGNGCELEANEGSEFIAQAGSTVCAYNGSKGRALADSNVTAFFGATVIAEAESYVTAYSGSRVARLGFTPRANTSAFGFSR